MSDFRIRNGGHEGNYAKVDKDGRLLSYASHETEFAFISEHKKRAYEFHPNTWEISTSYQPYVWMKNTSSTDNFLIEYIRLGWNGGNTNHDRIMSFRTYRNMAEPTANAVTGKFGTDDGPHNLNLSSEVEAEIDFRFWDGVGSGMTVADVGQQINCGPVDKGSNYITYGGALIIPPSSVLGFSLKGEETGNGIIVIAGFFKG